jgi:hypothetical protein
MRIPINTWLDDICNLSNTYNITPKRVIRIYNKCHDKSYIYTVKDGLDLTKRYIRMNYNLRSDNKNFNAKTYHEFTSRDIL